MAIQTSTDRIMAGAAFRAAHAAYRDKRRGLNLRMASADERRELARLHVAYEQALRRFDRVFNRLAIQPAARQG